MIDTICREIRNYFTQESDKFIDDYAIVNGEITPPISMQSGQYFKIWDSAFNDDVYIKGQEELKDESVFHGAVWLMRPPKDFLVLVGDIVAWQSKYGNIDNTAMSPYTSESFNNYSYSKNISNNSGAGGANWQSVFASRLATFRRYMI